MSVKVAINGFGRIGRNILRASIESKRNDAAKAKKEIERKQIDIQDQSSMTVS